jgi:peptidylprolyl isomerase
LLALLVGPLLLVAAWGGGGDGSSGGSSKSSKTAGASSGKQVTDLADVQVSDKVGEKPTLKLDGHFETDSTKSRVITEGKGADVQPGEVVRMNFAIYNGQDGAEVNSSFGAQPQYLMLDPGAVIQPFIDGLKGVKVGSRVLLAVPPQDTAAPSAPNESPSATPSPTKTPPMLFVIDVTDAFPGRATGKPVSLPKGLPAIKLGDKGQPTVTMPKEDPPKELLVQPLITGTGPQVKQGQTVTAMYSGLKWGDGKMFDTTWQDLIPRDFPIGVGQVIPAWDIALVGQPVGSQVLVVAPPAQGYGKDGNPQAGISGTDTLVFVVDILDAN